MKRPIIEKTIVALLFLMVMILFTLAEKATRRVFPTASNRFTISPVNFNFIPKEEKTDPSNEMSK
jgi:hypothetical protein